LKGGHWRNETRLWDKEYLKKEYVEKNKSAKDIAKENGITENGVFYWLAKHKIPRRTTSEARKVKKWGSRGSSNPMYGRCGDKNPRWIDGSSPERQKIYARSFWKELAKAVYERDGYKCKRCGAKHTGKNKLHAHHIKPWAGNPNSRLDLKNIIVLCSDCHTWVHSKGNKKSEFLSR
jgi:5-methylcytosine-specific restriction endonuclease McrA